jgi:NitT/TauT family transport system ATP-binding protein
VTPTATLELAAVVKRYGGTDGIDAVGPVDLTVGDREVVALLGPSGCGKTTLLRMMAGLIVPSSGVVLLAGRPPTDADGATVGLVFQDSNLLPWMSVLDNVALPLRLRGVPKAERTVRAEELCELVGIGGFGRRRPDALSPGMRQRAATARALSGEPDVLLLDEPFASLDALARDELNLELQRIWLNAPRCTVLITHNIVEAVFLADRVVSMSSRPGRVTRVTAVEFPRPRTIELQATREFQDIVIELRRALATPA